MSNAATDLEQFRQKLVDIRKALETVEEAGDAAAGTVELDQSRVGRLSRMDAMQAQAMSIEAKRRREVQLRRVDAALQRIEENEYGICLDCGEDIDVRRLEFDPATPLCVSCASRAEN